jgi:hypothetical protein
VESVDPTISLYLFDEDISDQKPREHKKQVHSHVSISDWAQLISIKKAIKRLVVTHQRVMDVKNPKNSQCSQAVEDFH